ncbi:MAG: polyphosphate kinase 1 [Anaerolineales bacterium]|nr:polyphosphate kinase 1 [Anaerolineae bacterium]PWB50880.1 MAG: polyphosphate kinase 1 [Anaerolineales bacterium]
MDTTTEKTVSPETIIDLDSPRLFINRELSALQFQHRVFEEAVDENNPLLERVKFLAIVGSNLDEFFMVRVAGLKKQVDAGVLDLPADGLTPAEQLAEIRKVASSAMKEASSYFRTKLIPALKDAGIFILDYKELNKQQKENIENYYRDVIFPVLTPLAFDPGHPFPHISNLSLNMAVLLKDKKGNQHFARIKVPNTLPRLVPIKRSSGGVRKDGTVPYHHYFVWLEQVIATNLSSLFPGMEVVQAYPFRVVRDADMAIQELEAADLLETMEQTVRQRRFGTVIMITINETMSARIQEILIENLEITRNEVYTIEGPMGYSDLWALHAIDRYDIKDPPFKPAVPRPLKHIDGENIFAAIREHDILLHHPYDSFSPVIKFLKTAANDPDVLAIKMTLYRVGSKPPVVDALLEAAENGKQVAVLVELKARFDEESNIVWARMLEKEGVHVVYGLLGLKTHSKVAMVIRKEGEGITRYLHLATGNYNAITAQIYEDIGMFTCDPQMGADATDLFNYLTGYSSKKEYLKLLVAPINLRSQMTALINREIEIQRNGGQGHLIFKINSLVDKKMIQLLYVASQAGVKVDLFVRGICCLRPGLPGVSDNIQVTSIVGRFLEHSRIYYFKNGGNEEIYLGSADLMPRNIDRRVEALFPVQDKDMILHIRDNILKIYYQDNIKARRMLADGSYVRVKPQENDEPLSIQNWFITSRR